jgi:hypothetical protein
MAKFYWCLDLRGSAFGDGIPRRLLLRVFAAKPTSGLLREAEALDLSFHTISLNWTSRDVPGSRVPEWRDERSDH